MFIKFFLILDGKSYHEQDLPKYVQVNTSNK